MADDRYRQDHPPHSRPEDRQSQHHSQSHYPPSAESTPRPSDGQRVNSMAASITLPPMQDHRAGGYGPPPHPQGYSYPSDPRYASPNATNGYPPPPGQSGYLPPPQQQSDPRAPSYRPPEHHYQGRPPPSYSHDPHYPPPQDYYYRQQAQGPPPPSHYPYGPPGGAPLHHYPPEYAQAQAPPMAQAAPRQRTSIACKYCRKRKIRCSGYQSAPGGKCQNCARMNQECVFQPVSSSSSTAFIPVSAVPGGVPPGTPLFGAYGQPLPQTHHYPSAATAQQPPGYPHAGAPLPQHAQQPPHHPSQQGPLAQSPSESSYSYTSGRADEGSQTSRRRRRSSASQEEGEQFRLPPPRPNVADEEPRRRSPAEHSNTSSPGVGSFPHLPGTAHETHPCHSFRLTRIPDQAATRQLAAISHLCKVGRRPHRMVRAVPPHHPTTNLLAEAPAASKSSQSVMSLSNLVDKNDIDKGMIDRLNRPRQ
uniref:Zn(2)-C6 fungal-type domain-containing protein n=1 Tax=Bionectria ochroleuca TaxID=29856 RepID=A0A8H7NLN6_BIOOC